MRTSVKGQVALAVSEGVVNTAYLDSVRVWTFGIGHTASAGAPNPLDWRGRTADIPYIMQVFARDLRTFEDIVNKAVKVGLNQHEFDALVHFAYNIGGPGFNRSRLVRLLNEGNKKEAFASGFHGWLKPPELRGRRDRERAIAQRADYGPTIAPLYTANAAGTLQRIGTVDVQRELSKGSTAPATPTPVAPTPTSPAPQKRTVWQWFISLFARS